MEKAVVEILQESWNSSILLTRVASHSRTASKNWGHSGRRLLVIHSVDFQWMPGNGTTSKCIYLRCWSDLSLILFSMQSTDSSTRMRKTNTKNSEENNLNHRCQTSKLKPVLFLQVCSAFRSGNGHQTHSLWSCHLLTARGGESPLLLPIWTLWERERDMMWCFSLLQLGALH